SPNLKIFGQRCFLVFTFIEMLWVENITKFKDLEITFERWSQSLFRKIEPAWSSSFFSFLIDRNKLDIRTRNIPIITCQDIALRHPSNKKNKENGNVNEKKYTHLFFLFLTNMFCVRVFGLF